MKVCDAEPKIDAWKLCLMVSVPYTTITIDLECEYNTLEITK